MSVFMIVISVMMSLMAIPHILTMIKTKSSRDQSLIGLIGVTLGICCWIWYGATIGDYTIVYCNLIMLSTYIAYITTAVYFRLKPCALVAQRIEHSATNREAE